MKLTTAIHLSAPYLVSRRYVSLRLESPDHTNRLGTGHQLHPRQLLYAGGQPQLQMLRLSHSDCSADEQEAT